MISFNLDNKKTILSIDGGGMRGMIPLKMLVYLEGQTGQPAYELFDMVAGTSTGAIIAAGLGLGMSAREILTLAYREKLPQAFGNRGFGFWIRYFFTGLRHLYPIEPFVEALGPFARNATVGDIQQPIILMTTKDVRTSNTYFVVNKGPGSSLVKDWSLMGAVAASAAAPVYFPPVLGYFIDGGVGTHGNPCLAAAIEAFEYLGFQPDNTLHISLGTGYIPNSHPKGASGFWLKDWIEYVIGEQIDDAALQQVYTTRKLYDASDFRRYNPDLSHDNVRDVLGVDTRGIDTTKLNLDTTDDKALDVMEAIGMAYAEKIDWTQADAMPWDTVGGHVEPTFEPVVWKGTIFQP